MFFRMGDLKGRRLAHSPSLLHWLSQGFHSLLVGVALNDKAPQHFLLHLWSWLSELNTQIRLLLSRTSNTEGKGVVCMVEAKHCQGPRSLS